MTLTADAELMASLFAVDPHAVGGACVRSLAGPVRDQWLALVKSLLPAAAPWRRMPFNIADGRLLGGLDLAATLKSRRPVAERGLLAQAHGGVVVLSMAERLSAQTCARINAVMDRGEAVLSREGVFECSPAALGLIALDEGMSEEEYAPASLLDRCAFLLDLNLLAPKCRLNAVHTPVQIRAARELLTSIDASVEVLNALCATAMALGVHSARAGTLALQVAKAAAALQGRNELLERDATLAARLVLAPRATIAPPASDERDGEDDEPEQDEPAPTVSPADEKPADETPPANAQDPEKLQEIVLAATRAAIPAGLLAKLRGESQQRTRSRAGGRSGALQRGGARGRPAGIIAGAPRGAARLNVIETLRAAAPWQVLRRRQQTGSAFMHITADDFRVTRCKQQAQTLTIFAIDASGSAALHRLAEAKGAVELLLADCYIRRDQVAVIAFRGRHCELLLAPTRSLVRAKRSLAGLPGGGGTPLAAAIDAALDLAVRALRRGETPTLVLLTDGRANVARDGSPGRELAQLQALRAATAVSVAKIKTLFVDTSPRANDLGQELARQMSAQYLPLPNVDARTLSKAVKRVSESRRSPAADRP